MASLEFSVPLPTIKNAIQGSKAIVRLQNPAPLYKAWGNYLEELTTRAYKTETAPFGSGWPALKPETIKRTPNRRGGILRVTNQLYTSTVAQVLPDGAQIGSNLVVGEYSLLAIHQYGAPRAKIPARRVLPVNAQGDLLPQVEDECFALAEDYILG